MSLITLSPNAAGTGTFTIASPNSNTDRTLNLPDQTGTLLTGSGALNINASAPTSSLTLDASGRLGLGQTSIPSGVLFDLKEPTAGTDLIIGLSAGTGARAQIRSIAFGDANSSALSFHTTSGGSTAERTRINSIGAFKQQSAGASYEDTSLGYSEFNNGESGTAALLQRCTNASFNGSVSALKTTRAANTAFNFISAQANAVTQFSVRGDGNAYNTNNSYGALSDAKLKENVVDATPKLEKLNQIRVVNFNLIGSEQKQIGVIAQELEQVFPGMVDETSDRDAEGNDLGTTTKSVKYSVFVPMLIKAIQELKADLDATKAELAALKGQQ